MQRIGPLGITQSALHAKAIKSRKTGTHISKTPALFYDVSVWNKLFRKSFWDMHGLVFPEGMVWEDLHHDARAHVLARAVDVITDPIYYWRERGTGALSITQSRTDISNYTDRITRAAVHRRVPARRTSPPAWSASTSARRWTTTSGCTSASWAGPADGSTPSS